MADIGTRSPLGDLAPSVEELHRNWGWLLALGIIEVLLGAIGLAVVGLVTLASVLFVGWLLIASGVLHLIRAFRTRGWEGVALHILIGILQGVVGVLLLLNPAVGAASLTLLMAALFIVSGLFRIVFALSVRIHGWGWQVLAGLVAFALGLLISAGWPATSVWVIGTFVSIDLIFAGWSFVMIALAVRRPVAMAGTPSPARV
jgi:uncharacterized membrane protein HdeD (DUF308 family)